MSIAEVVVGPVAGLELPPDDRPLDPVLPPLAAPRRHSLALSVIGSLVAVAAVVALGWWRVSSATEVEGGPGIVPAVAITAPATGNLIGDDTQIRIDAHDAVRVDLFVDADWTGTDRTPPFTPEWEHRSAGTHELKAKVTSADGTVRYSEPVTVIVG